MSHIHVPDGVFPLWLVAIGWLATGALLASCTLRLRGGDQRRQVPLLGVMAAVMLIAMSTEVVPIGYHVNLTVIAGIVLGPVLGFVAAFIVNLMLALLGHGGVTVVGLNTLIIGAEVALGYYAFRGLYSLVRRFVRSPAPVAGLATFATLFATTWLFIGIVAASRVEPGDTFSVEAINPENLSFENLFGQGLLATEGASPHGEAEDRHQELGFQLFVRLVLFLGFIGWVIEAVIVGLMVGFIHKVRPELIAPSRASGGPGAFTSSSLSPPGPASRQVD